MKHFSTLSFTILLLLACNYCNAQLTGTINVPNATYANLGAVITALNTQGVGAGGVIINLTAGNPQTAPSGGYLLGSTTLNASTSITQTITINGNGNTVTAPVGTSTSLDGIFIIRGTDYVSINGLNLAESAANTTATTAMEYGYALFNLNATAPFDGCQNVAIQNCTVTMNRTVATPSKAIFVAHQVYTSTTALLPTATADMHNSNKFYGNTLTNCISGIYIGGATSANDVGNDIGGISAATGNTINNVIGALYSSVGAITCTYQTNCNISYTTINNTANGGTNAIATAWGIYAYGPSCTYTVNNNSVTLTEASISTAYAIYGIYGNAALANITANNNTVTVSEASGSAVNNIAIFLPNGSNTTINNNTVTQNMALSGTTYGIYITSSGAAAINGNTVKQTASVATSSQFYSIVSGGTGTSESIQNNVFDNTNVSVASTTGYMALIYTSNGTGNKTISGNSINGTVSHSSSADFYAVLDNPATAPGAGTAVISNNNFTGISKSGTGGVYCIYEAPTVATSRNLRISGNIFTNLAHTGTGPLVGIYYASGTNDSIYNNQLSGITGAGSVFGIYGTSPAAVNAKVYKNKIYTMASTNAAGGVFGISVADGTATSVYNNYIGDLQATTATGTADAIRGISLLSTTAASAINVYYNTIYLNATSSGASFSTSGIYHTASTTANTAALDMRNNIIVNTSTATGTGITSAYRRSGTGLNNYSNTSNNNLFYAGTPGASNVIMYDGTNTYPGLAAYKTAVSTRDAASITEVPNFLSTTGSSANYLHIALTAATGIESGGTAISGITDDYDGDVRQGNTGYTGGGSAPDIGADEFNLCNTITYTAQPPATVTICEAANTSFTIAATNAVTYQWQVNTGSGFTNVSNGGVYGGAATPTLTITAATPAMSGYIYRCMAQYSPACPLVASGTTTLTVNPLPVVTVSASGSTSFCTGSSVTLSVPLATGINYQWQNSGNISGATNNSYTASTSGSYVITATNPATTCTATSAPVTVTVGIGPVATITPSGTIGYCPGGTTTLSANVVSGVTYQWQLNGTDITGATNATYAAGTAGSYTVKVSTSPTCFTLSAATTVIQYTLPVVTTTPSGTTAVCQGSTTTLTVPSGTGYTYQWMTGASNIPGATNATYPAGTAGSYTVKVINPATTCSATSAAITVNVNPLPPATATASGPSTICADDSTTLTANNGVALAYQWKTGTTIISGATAISYKAYLPGSYTVVVTDGNNCSATSAPVTVTVNPKPSAVVTYNSPLVFCQGGAVVLNAVNATGLAYQWLNNGNVIIGGYAASYVAYTSGSYRVKITSALGCTSYSQPISVTQNLLPSPIITRNGYILSTGNFVTYQWYFNNTPLPNGQGPSVTAMHDGLYHVVVTDANGCENSSVPLNINTLSVTGPAGTAQDVKIYPNPAGQFVNIDAPVAVNVKLRDITGRTVLAADHAERLDLGRVPSGVYLLTVFDTAGNVLKTEKLFKTE
ncbi:T9SS type A sorting domain-containing protein [Chitinophagaceae bacterium MMS25-I14]